MHITPSLLLLISCSSSTRRGPCSFRFTCVTQVAENGVSDYAHPRLTTATTTTSTSSLLKLTPTIRSGSLKTKVVYTSTGTSPASLLAPASSPAPALALSTISTLLTMMLSTLGSSLLNASYSRSTSSPYLSDAQLAAHNFRCSQRCHL